MKSIIQSIFEAASKPSDLKKLKDTSKTVDVHFKSGDVFDLSDNGYTDKFTYYSGEGNGYIKDKKGNVYDVFTSERQGDAGFIAGGSTSFFVKIAKANGKDDFVVTGYMGIMTRSENTGCVSDIKKGYYLEDYIAKYITRDQQDKFGEIAAKGDKNAKSYEKSKEDDKKDRYAAFFERYLVIPNKVFFEINKEGLQFTSWSPGTESGEYKEIRKKMMDEYRANGKSDEYNKMGDNATEIRKKVDQVIHDTFRPTVEQMIQKIFKTKDVKSLSGIAGQIVYDKSWISNKKDIDDFSYAIDTKKKEVVKVQYNNSKKRSKITDYDVELRIADNIRINKKFMNEKTEKLFKAVAQAWKKNNGGKQGEYIENNWKRIQKESGGYWGWTKTTAQAKSEAKEEYKKLLKAHNWDDNDELEFSLALVILYVEGDIDPDQGPVEKPLENPEPSKEKKERGKETKMSAGANKAAYDKMQQWHDGKRKQNLSNCSDAKLKMNYKVCKELGFDKEMDLIKKEADSRGIVLESISLLEMVQADHENILED